MVILQMSGGLGNQMFQYALLRALCARGREVKVDDVTGFAEDAQREPVLKATFPLDYVSAQAEEILEMTDRDRHLKEWLRRRFTGGRGRYYREPADGNFDEGVFDVDDVYLTGCWQSELYFAEPKVQEELRRDFTLLPECVLKSAQEKELAARIAEAEAVSIHIRRGDYLNPGTVENHGNICTEEYYHRAIDYMVDRHPRAVFFVFSNDIPWAETHFTGERFVIADAPQEGNDTAHLYLMSRCRHHIIANSSFSWWGAWLSAGEDKTIVAPAKWLNNKNMTDIYTEKMIRL